MFNLGDTSMKKTLIALAALAATSAFAQSSVTLSGVVGYGYQSGTTAVGNKGFTNTDMTFALGVTEDLGGGLKVSAATNFDTTGSTFASNVLRRNSSLGLSGDFGTVSIINTRSSDLLTSAMVAPSYLPDGMYDGSGVIARAAVDVFQYTLPAFGGFTPYVQYVETATDGNTTPVAKVTVVGATYVNGPLRVGANYKSTTGLPAGAIKGNAEAFATYDLGFALVGVGYDGKMNATGVGETDVVAANAGKGASSFGLSVPLGALTVGANYAARGDADVAEFAAKYDLSKRTSARFSFGSQSVDARSQYRLALVHTF